MRPPVPHADAAVPSTRAPAPSVVGTVVDPELALPARWSMAPSKASVTGSRGRP